MLRLALCLMLTVVSTLPAQAEISAAGWAQLEFLQAEVETFSEAEKKLPTAFALELRRRAEPDRFQERVPEFRPRIVFESDGKVRVRLQGEVRTRTQEEAARRGVVWSKTSAHLVASLVLEDILALAEAPDVKVIYPELLFEIPEPPEPLAPQEPAMANTTEGDVAHEANIARSQYGADGTNVIACVLDNGGIDSLAAVQASGDLPSVTVLPGFVGTGDHGTAVLEILHDIAPGATLKFAGANELTQAAAALRNLRDAGCRVIAVPFDFEVPFTAFQDNAFAQAVEELAASHVFVFVAAGNRGSEKKETAGTWEGDFDSLMVPIGNTHDWSGTGDNTNKIEADSISNAPTATEAYFLEWTDPVGGSGNDYNLALFNAAGTAVLELGNLVQNGDDDPVEFILRSTDDTNNQLVATLRSGAPRYLRLAAGTSTLEHRTTGAIAGVAGAESAFTIAASDVGTAGGGPFTGFANPVESFSSDGPRRVYFTAEGMPLTPGDLSSTGGEVRDKPNYVGADRVSTATPGFSTFVGTSAATPHIAGIAALVVDIWPAIAHAELKDVLTNAALDTEDIGPDENAGAGIVRATQALAQASMVFEDGFESGDTSAWQ